MSYGYEYVKLVETSKKLELVSFGDKDTYNYTCPCTRSRNSPRNSKGNFRRGTISLRTRVGTLLAAARRQKLSQPGDSADPSRRRVVGDQEDLYGPLVTYQTLQKHDKKNLVFLVEGPWNHGGWRGKGRSLAQVDFGSDTGTYFREKIEAPWFAYYLKDKGNLKQAEATIFQSGTNKWMTYDAWPPRRKVHETDLFLQAQQYAQPNQ